MQTFEDVLFLHWPLEPEAISAQLPRGVELDTYQDWGWLTLIAFRMRNMRVRGLPSVPGLRTYPQLNMRTYVKVHGKPGVYLFSMETNNFLSVWGARHIFKLPYAHAGMTIGREGQRIYFGSHRPQSSEVNEARLRAHYQPDGVPFPPAPESVECFLMERYTSFLTLRTGQLASGRLEHPPWVLTPAKATLHENSYPEALGISVARSEPLIHYVPSMATKAWLFQKL